jgi:hypothetical protein
MEVVSRHGGRGDGKLRTPINPVSQPNNMPPNDAMAVSRYARRYVLMSRHTAGRSSFAMMVFQQQERV